MARSESILLIGNVDAQRVAVSSTDWLRAFCDVLDVRENALMDAMNSVIRDRPPIPLWRNRMDVPRSALQDGARTILLYAKLAVMRNHVVFQMWRVEIAIG